MRSLSLPPFPPSSHHPLSCSQRQSEQKKTPRHTRRRTPQCTKEGMSGCHLRHTSILIALNQRGGLRSDQKQTAFVDLGRETETGWSAEPQCPGRTCFGEGKQIKKGWGGIEWMRILQTRKGRDGWQRLSPAIRLSATIGTMQTGTQEHRQARQGKERIQRKGVFFLLVDTFCHEGSGPMEFGPMLGVT